MTARNHFNHITHIWPIWPTLKWGIGIAFQYFDAYHNKHSFAEREYWKFVEQDKQL